MAARLAWLLTLSPLLLSPVAAAAPESRPAVARARYEGTAEVLTGGTVFFLAPPGGLGPAAVGAAHSFDLEKLAQARYLDFRLGHRQRRVAISSRYLVPPGRPFSDSKAGMRGDYVVFLLDGPPSDARLLEAEMRAPQPNQRVQVIGIPVSLKADEDDIFGRVREVGETRIEIDLDVPYDLRGWGGAPVLSYDSGRVIGILQAAWPNRSTLRVAASPIGGVLEALKTPLEGGRGKLFAAFAKSASARSASRGAPGKRSPESSSAGNASSDRPDAQASRRVAQVEPRSSLLGKNIKPAEIPLWVEIEHPSEGDILGNPAGAFVAGRALAPRGQYRRLDVIVVVDTSGSTREPTGVDVNGNGVVGERQLGTLGSLFDLSSTDSGDSILAAEVAAARRLVRSLDPRATRVGLVTFAGEVESNGFFRRQRNPVVTEVPLTTDYEQIERALDRVLERGPKGSTNMAAGVNQATIELIGAKGALSEPHPQAEKAVLFFTDGRPTLPFGPGHEAENVKEVLRAAELAERAEVRFFTFGIGEEALAGPIAVVELAARTKGYFTPVRHPGNLLDVIEEVDFANVEELAVRNKTTGEQSNMVFKSPDGGFSALLTLEPGRNAIEVWARSSDGTEASDTVTVSYAPGAAEVPLPRPLAAQYNRLLERRLIELRRGRVEVEREHAEQTRKELKLEIERERELAQERAEEQRKELDLSVEDQPPS